MANGKEKRISEDSRKILKIVANNPYIEKKDLRARTDLGEEDFDCTTDELVDENFLVKMTRQSGSSMESRVPSTVYLLNPEKESDLDLGS